MALLHRYWFMEIYLLGKKGVQIALAHQTLSVIAKELIKKELPASEKFSNPGL